VHFGAYSSSTNILAIYDSQGAGFVAGVNETTMDETGNGFLGFGDFSLSSADHPTLGGPVMVFVSSVAGADGVYLRMPDGQLVTVATTLMTSPSGSAYNFLSQPGVEVSEEGGSVLVSFAARAGTVWRGIMLAEVSVETGDVKLSTVADTSTLIPGTDLPFKCLSVPQVTAGRQVVFFGSHCGSSGASAMVQNQWSNLALYDDQPVAQHPLTGHRDVSVGVSVLSPGLWRSVGGELSAVASDQTEVPQGQPGETFTAFSNPGVGIDGTVAFVALGSNQSYGVYKSRATGGLELVVNNKVDVPGYPGCAFANFPQPPSVDDVGNAIFSGKCEASVGGVYYEAGDSLGTVLDYNDTIDDVPLVYVGYGTNSYSGNRAAVYLLLENNSNGIWTFDIPPPTNTLLV
jgi:hypothetical protein